MIEERGAGSNVASSGEQSFEYVVTGSAQRSGPGTLRVNMQITDAATAEYRWAGRYEFDPEDLAPMQTEITRQISRELHLLLLQEASRRAYVSAGVEFGVNECLARAPAALIKGDAARVDRRGAELVSRRAGQRPAQCRGAGRSGQDLPASRQPTLVGRSPRRRGVIRSRAAKRSRSRSNWRPDTPLRNASRECYTPQQDGWRKRRDAFEQALAMDQWLASAHGFAGYNAAFLGHAEETLPAVERAMRLDRIGPAPQHFLLLRRICRIAARPHRGRDRPFAEVAGSQSRSTAARNCF